MSVHEAISSRHSGHSVATDGRVRGPGPGGAALVLTAITILVVETSLAYLGHSTHLLLVLVIVVGAALWLGPGPGAIGLAAGGTGSAAASVATGQVASSLDSMLVALASYAAVGVMFLFAVRVTWRRREPAAAAGPSGRAWIPPVGFPPLVESLTPREAEILRMAASGSSVDEIAGRLVVSPNTVKTHLTHVYGKLGARGRSDAIRAGLHHGLLRPTDICPHLATAGGGEPHRYR